MKKLITIISILFAISLTAAEKATVRIGSYNLWMTQLGKGDYAWDVRKTRLAQSIADVNFDIFGVQELSSTAQKDLPALITEAGGANYEWIIFSPYKEDGGVGNKAQAIVWKADKYELTESHHFWFSETPEVMSAGWDEQKYKRGGLCAIFKDRKTGVRFFVLHAHMPLGQEANLHATEILIEKSRRYNPDNLPEFFLGDFNTRPDTPSSKLMRTYWTDSYLSCKKAEQGIGTFHAADTDMDMRTARRIDYIYWKGDVKLKDYEVVTTRYDGFFPSDHCPLYVDAMIRN